MARQRVPAQVALAGVEQGDAAVAREPAGEQRQVAAIGGERVGGEPLLDPERVDESVDRRRARRLSAHSSLSFCAATTFL
jgi:hypothetical protein